MADKASKLTPAEVATLMADAVAWKAEDGDEIQGVVLGVKRGTSDYGVYPIVFVLTNDGECRAIHGFHSVLDNELRSQRPENGEVLYVKRLGVDPTREVKKGQSGTIRFAVYVEREGGGNAWDNIPAAE